MTGGDRRRASRRAKPTVLRAAIADALRAVAPADVSLIDWVAGRASVDRTIAERVLTGVDDPTVDVADTILRSCTGRSLAALADDLRLSPGSAP